MKKIIFNADDFGYSFGINKGIIKAHKHGVVTSTSVMVFRPAAHEAKNLVKNCPKISIGLHFDITDEGIKADFMKKIGFGLTQIKKIEKQFNDQINKFIKIVGKKPDHLDAHHHVHFHPKIKPIFEKYSQKYKTPVRGFKPFNFIDNFFGWNKFRKQDLKRIGVDNLIKILSSQLTEGINEIMCHPGFIDENLKKISGYLYEREKEVKTLTSPKIINYLKKNNIQLINWKEAAKFLN